MATSTEKTTETSLAKHTLNLLWYYVGGRRRLIILTVVLLAAGAAFNWSWLVAAGIAPLFSVLALGAVMYGFGVCMNKVCGASRSPRRPRANRDIDKRSPSAAPNTMRPDNPIVVVPDEKTPTLAEEGATDSEEQGAAFIQREAAKEKS